MEVDDNQAKRSSTGRQLTLNSTFLLLDRTSQIGKLTNWTASLRGYRRITQLDLVVDALF